MSQTDIEARAETIADIFLEANALADVEASAKAKFIDKIGSSLKDGMGMLATTVLPVLAVFLGF